MSKVTFLVGQDTIHLNYDGKHIGIKSGDKNFGEVRQMIKEGRQDEIPEIFSIREKSIEEYIEGSGLTLNGDNLADRQGNLLPAVLNKRLQDLKEDGFDVTNLVKFWENLKQNPSMNSRNQLYVFLEQNGHPITDDGHFIAYRGVRRDFKDKHTGTFDNSPGSVCEMPRSEVDDNPNQTCSSGLHVAAFDYASGFGDVTVEVKVNPRDVVAVPADYRGQKMRVCRFEVIQQCEAARSESLYDHSYESTWDGWEDDSDDNDDEFIECVLELADEFGDRYKDNASLAVRIDEELGGGVVRILKILNDEYLRVFSSQDSES